MTDGYLNGINLEEFNDTIRTLRHDPTIATFRFRARNNWISGGENRTEIDGYFGACEEHQRDTPFILVNDEPRILLGTDKNANPIEHVLHALAGCLTTTLILQATARGIRIDEIETQFSGQLDLRGFLGLDGPARTGFEHVTFELKVHSDAPPAMLLDLCEIAQQRSPVFDIISNGVPVNVKLSAAARPPAED